MFLRNVLLLVISHSCLWYFRHREGWQSYCWCKSQCIATIIIGCSGTQASSNFYASRDIFTAGSVRHILMYFAYTWWWMISCTYTLSVFVFEWHLNTSAVSLSSLYRKSGVVHLLCFWTKVRSGLFNSKKVHPIAPIQHFISGWTWNSQKIMDLGLSSDHISQTNEWMSDKLLCQKCQCIWKSIPYSEW